MRVYTYTRRYKWLFSTLNFVPCKKNTYNIETTAVLATRFLYIPPTVVLWRKQKGSFWKKERKKGVSSPEKNIFFFFAVKKLPHYRYVRCVDVDIYGRYRVYNIIFIHSESKTIVETLLFFQLRNVQLLHEFELLFSRSHLLAQTLLANLNFCDIVRKNFPITIDVITRIRNLIITCV